MSDAAPAPPPRRTEEEEEGSRYSDPMIITPQNQEESYCSEDQGQPVDGVVGEADQQYEENNWEDDNNGWGTHTQQENQYFNSYAHLAIHEEMIKDFTRTYSYKKAIFEHTAFFQDKVVLDVGCGTGILSIFCARAGARKVYGIEASGIADKAVEVIEANGLSDKVTIIKGLVEEIELPEKVDVIISEWMGYFLIYEAMLKAVIVARDRFLKDDGHMFPAEANLYVNAFSDQEYYSSKIDFWRNVFDIDMSVLIPTAKQTAFYGAAVDSLKPENLVSEGILIKQINCATVTAEELDETFCKFQFKFLKDCGWHGFIGWFDVVFKTTKDAKDDPNCVVLSTSPEAGYTHWHHTLFMFEDPIPVLANQSVRGHVSVRPHPNAPRHLAISFSATTDEHAIAKTYDF